MTAQTKKISLATITALTGSGSFLTAALVTWIYPESDAMRNWMNFAATVSAGATVLMLFALASHWLMNKDKYFRTLDALGLTDPVSEDEFVDAMEAHVRKYRFDAKLKNTVKEKAQVEAADEGRPVV